MRLSIRDVGAVCPEASTSGSADLRDTALELASRLAPPGSSLATVAQIAAALILLSVGKDPSDCGVSVDAEVLARANLEHEALMREKEGPQERAERVEREARRALLDFEAAARREGEAAALRYEGLERELAAAAEEAAGLRKQLDAALGDVTKLRGQVAGLRKQLDEARPAAPADAQVDAAAGSDAPAQAAPAQGAPAFEPSPETKRRVR